MIGNLNGEAGDDWAASSGDFQPKWTTQWDTKFGKVPSIPNCQRLVIPQTRQMISIKGSINGEKTRASRRLSNWLSNSVLILKYPVLFVLFSLNIRFNVNAGYRGGMSLYDGAPKKNDSGRASIMTWLSVVIFLPLLKAPTQPQCLMVICYQHSDQYMRFL